MSGFVEVSIDVLRKHGFPEALVLRSIGEEFEHRLNNPRVVGSWVKLSNDDLFMITHELLGKSTLRLAVRNLVNDGLLKKGRPKGATDSLLDRTCWYSLPSKK